MTNQVLKDIYQGEVRDRVENFSGNQLIYVGWDHHLMFCSAFTFLVSPNNSFDTLINEVIIGAFTQHPEWSEIEWSKVQWLLDGNSFIPDMKKSLAAQGIGHKSLLRFNTPELKGFKGAGV